MTTRRTAKRTANLGRGLKGSKKVSDTQTQNRQMEGPVGNKATLESALMSPAIKKPLMESIPKTMAAYVTPERILRVIAYELTRNPTLLKCSLMSVISGIMRLAQLGFEPGGPLGRAWLIPYQNGRTRQYEAQPIIGYKGYIDLMRRSGEVTSVQSFVIYEHDEYVVRYGDEPGIEHEPRLDGDRGDWVAAYAVISIQGGGRHVELMTRSEIDAIRARSPGRDHDAWRLNTTQMARKTVIRRAANYIPMSVDLIRGLEIEAAQAPQLDSEAIVDVSLPPTPTKSDELADALLASQGEAANDSDFHRGDARVDPADPDALGFDPQNGVIDAAVKKRIAGHD